MASNPVLVEFFYDIISPYSFLAFEVLQRYKTIWNIDLKLKPIFLLSIMELSGNFPKIVPNKGIYVAKDLERLQKYFKVPLTLPGNLMDLIKNKASLTAMRFIITVEMQKPEYVEKISQALFNRLYKDNKDIEEFDSLREVARSINMEPDIIEKCLEIIHNDEVSMKFVLHSLEADEYKAFGAPMIVAHIKGKPEVFFGSDRFELLAHELGEKWYGPVPPASLQPASKL